MDSLNEWKSVWLTAATGNLPAAGEYAELVKNFRREKLRSKFILGGSAIGLALLLVALVFVYQSSLLTTRLGELLLIAACTMLAATNIRSARRFYQLQDHSNREFLEFLAVTRLNQLRYYHRTQGYIMFTWSSGLLCYLYEIVYKNTWWLVLTYGTAMIFFLSVWFIFRPRTYKKNAARLEATRKRLEKLHHQLNEYEK